ncbi:MAG: PD-(D/E)XK nuclease family protein [Oscillospiraceae bacterium]
MLKLLIGTAGTGKTTRVISEIIALASKGEKCLLLVPEQFSKTGEAQLFSALKNTQLHLVRLFSFTSLLRDVQSNHRHLKGTLISAAGKAVMAKRAVDGVRNQASSYAKRSGNLAFSFQLSNAFDDFKRSGLDGETLFQLAKKAPQKNAKLKEISMIYAEYCGLMMNKFCDGEDLLSDLAQNLPLDYLNDTHVFVDGFESFSHGQYEVLKNMLQNATDVSVTFTADTVYDETGGTGNFSFTQQSIKHLLTIAKSVGVKVASPVILKQSKRFKNSHLKNVDNFLLGGDSLSTEKIQGDKNAVFVTEFENQYREVAFLCAKINTLIMEGYTYNDIAVICPQLEKYENQIQESFHLAKIPFFIDQNRIISSSSPVMLFNSIFEVMTKGLNADTAMPLLKTHLTYFDDEIIDKLENYLYIWQDYNFDFSVDFTLSPLGLKAKTQEKEQAELKELNTVRKELCKIFSKNTSEKKEGKGGEILTLAYLNAKELKADEKLLQTIEGIKKTDESSADLLFRQWETVIGCIDELYKIINEEILSPKDISALFMLMVSGEKIGFAPQTQDCVMVTDPKRMKLEKVRAAFILGAAQDIFPAIISDDGVISAMDKDYLKENDYPLKTGFENLFSFENLYFYKALTTGEDLLFISCAQKNLDTKQLFSAEVENLRTDLKLPSAVADLSEYAITKEFFTEYLSEIVTVQSRQSALKLLEELKITSPQMKKREFVIKDLDYLLQCLGQSITLSPTGAESYFQCEFLYFIQNVLRIKPLEKVEFSARIAGDYLHFVAQNVMEKYGADYYKADWGQIEGDISAAVEQFVKENYPPEIARDEKFTAQHDNMHKNACELLQYIHLEQNNSLFRPIAFEEKIGLGGSVPALSVKTDQGKGVNVVGICDRVDLFTGEEKNYLRIVDYKTGAKKFSLDDIYNGLSTQLLLYMSALLEGKFKNIDNLAAGAVVYQPSDAAYKFDDEGDLYTAIGMAINNKEVSGAFDADGKGRFGVIKGKEKIAAAQGGTVVSEKVFQVVLQHAKEKIKQMAQGVYGGEFDSNPLENSDGYMPCNWCQFNSICQNKDKKRSFEKNNFKEKDGEEG